MGNCIDVVSDGTGAAVGCVRCAEKSFCSVISRHSQ